MTRLKIAKERLFLYYKAEKAILSSQSYSVGGQTLTRANLDEVRATIEKLEQEVRHLESGQSKRRVRRFVPIDW